MSGRKDIKQLIEKLEDQDWVVERTGGDHYRLKGPAGQLVFMSQSPSDFRAVRKARAFLRKNGADV